MKKHNFKIVQLRKTAASGHTGYSSLFLTGETHAKKIPQSVKDTKSGKIGGPCF